MSTVKELEARYVVEAKLLGQDKTARKNGREKEYAIQVTLSDESQYTMFRTLKNIADLHSKLISRFPVEAGYFKKSEKVIPECPIKQTIFGISRAISDDRSFEKLLNSFIKEIPGLPASIVKCDLVNDFFSLKASDISVPGSQNKKQKTKGKKSNHVFATEDSTISGPVALRSYMTVADYSDKKTKFSLAEGNVVQVMKKDPGGWWMVDNGGSIGWAPASFLVPVDPEDLRTEAQENERLIEPERVGARYISISSYQASRDDELSFVRGAVVKVIKKYVDGWWLVRYNGGEGYVPGAMFKRFDKRQATVYVKKIRRNFISRKSTRIIPTIKPKWLGESRATRRLNKVSKESDKPKLTLYSCKAVFEGLAEKYQLSVNKNDTVKVIDKNDHGWWYAEDQHGRSGWVPATYLRPILDTSSNRLAEGEKIVGTKQVVMRGHRAEQEDELTVRRGESVEVLMVSNDGWWVVRNNITGAQGLIPSLCLNQEAGTDDIAEEEDSPEPFETQSEPKGLEKYENGSPETGSPETGSPETGSLEDLDEAGNEIDLDGCYVATEDYLKQGVDELDLFEGQIVCVIDDSDNDVWYVNSDGKEGWVPADILKEYVDDDMTTSGESTPFSSNPVSGDELEIELEEDAHQDHSTTPRLSRRHGAIRHSRSHHSPEPEPTNSHLTAQTTSSHRKISAGSSISSGTSTNSAVTIMVDNKSLAELERESAEAERKLEEARQQALELKRKLQYVRNMSGESN